MKYAFNGFISKLDMAEERISGLEDITTETSTAEKQKKQRLKIQNRIYRNCRTTTKHKPPHDTKSLQTASLASLKTKTKVLFPDPRRFLVFPPK